MAGDVAIGIDILVEDGASGNIKNISDSLDELNKKTNTKLNDELKKTGDKANELGGKFKTFKEVSSNAMNTAVSSGAITGELGKITPVVGGVTEAFGTLLQTGFTPVGIAITGLGVALPFLISTLSDTKPSLDSLSQSFDSFKKSVNDANAQLFDAQSQMRNIKNSGLDTYLKEATVYFQDIEKANKRVKDNATQNAKEIASQYIKEFEKAGVQSSKVFKAFNIPDDVKANIEDFKSSITQGVFDSQSSVFKNGEEAVNKYGGTIKATFQSEEIVKYFEQSVLAGKDFDSAFSWISNKILGLNNLNSKSFQDASTVQGKFYIDLKKQMQDYYDAYKINNDKIRAENVKVELETAQRRKADMQKYLTQTTDYYQKSLDNYNIYNESENIISFKKYTDSLNAQGEFNKAEINLMKISSARKKELLEIENKERMTAIQDAEMNMIKMKGGLQQNEEPEQQIQSPLAGDDATGAIVADQAAAARETEKYWEEAFINMGKPLNGLMTDMSVSGEAGKAMGAVGGAGAKSLSDAFVQLGASGKLSLAAVGAAMKAALASELQAISMRAMVNGMMETAIGIAALTPYGALAFGPASTHFASAGAFFAAGAATGIAAGVIGGSGGATVPENPPAEKAKAEEATAETQKQDIVVNQTININGDIDKSNLEKLKKTQESMEYQMQQSMVA